MDPKLSRSEARVLGALIEKQLSTPQYYPLSLNALQAACNQKTNRQPVVSYDEATVERALDQLRAKDLVRRIIDDSARVARFAHRANVVWEVDTAGIALLCALLLRGEQTAGELRARTGRMHEFETLEQVEEALAALAAHEPAALARKLPMRPGEKENRWVHLLSGEPQIDWTAPPARGEEAADMEAGAPAATSASGLPSAAQGRLEQIEDEVAALRGELAALQEQFAKFKAQFE